MYVVLALVLGVIALTFFSAERSLSLFSWFRLQELNAPRSRKNAAGNCLRNRGLVVTAFLVAGCLAIAALSVVLVVGVKTRWAVGLEILFLVPLLGWILPEFIAWRTGDWFVLYLVPALYGIVGIPFRALRMGLLRQTATPGDESPQAESDSSSQADSADNQAHRMFRSAVRLKYIQVRDIMTPRTDMVTVADTATLREAARVSTESGYSRLPVHRSNRDQIVGILHAKDLLKFAATEKWDQPALPELLRQPSFVPETKTVSELMEELQRSNVHMGIVVDEYGGTRGIVTLEDVVEELIGEIRDEHELPHETPPLFKWVSDRSVELAASMRIEAFNNEFDQDLREEEGFDTVGGLATFMMAKIPQNGESFQVGGARITVIQADPRRVIRVRADFDRAPRRREMG
ncbi:MAG: hemolysin family protein [Candidatus Brocadiia bacterium]|jgi:magnesium and cobalt transporter